ncbi:membrane protein [soil metagenome]
MIDTDPAPSTTRRMLMKVPEITIIFWIAKLATTAFGEAFSDFVFFNDYIGQHLAILMGLAMLLICLAIQFTRKKYVPWVYWLSVTAVSIFGTMSADFLNKDLGMPLYASTLMLLGLQAVVFITWYATQKTLNVHSINTHLRELFYWLTVLFTFALGTAAGDFAATTLGLGTLASTFLFLAIILIPFVGYRWLKLNEVVAFWFAYMITRPLGASFADWLGVPAPYGDGLQLGTGVTSIIFGVILVGVIGALIVRRQRAKRVEAIAVR